MKNRVRVTSLGNLGHHAKVEVRDVAGEWHDISHAVTSARPIIEVGAVTRIGLDLRMVDVEAEAYLLDEDTQAAFAHVLREMGWTVEAPERLA